MYTLLDGEIMRLKPKKRSNITYMVLTMCLWITIACGSSSDDEETISATTPGATQNPVGTTAVNFPTQPPAFPLIDIVNQENQL